MYVKVRLIGLNSKDMTVNTSKITTVKILKDLITDETDIKPENQRLFYKGKQLEDEYKLFDYNIVLNDVIQLMVKSEIKTESSNEKNKKDNSAGDEKKEEMKYGHPKSCWKSIPYSLYFKAEEYVDVRNENNGAWFEGQIKDILANVGCNCCGAEASTKLSEEAFRENEELQKDIIYVVTYDKSELEFMETKIENIRPRARIACDVSKLKSGDKVIVNYNLEEPSSRGLWYDFLVTRVTKTGKSIFGNVLISLLSDINLKDCRVRFVNEVFKIEERIHIKHRNKKNEEAMKDPKTVKKTIDCSHCQDNDDKQCRECGCYACGGKEDPDKQLVCDECEMSYHLKCLKPPLESVPDEEEWFCPECKTDVSEVVMAGEKLMASKKKSNMVSANRESKRDWGSGMACVGRTKECTIVPSNHYGPIPGVEVGTTWLFRVQVSEAGIHRPHVAGIHGREVDGAYSIVLSGGYEDDVDNGEEFLYTGSGGRDLSGNKRTAEQSSHQQLTRTNMALAMNCDASIDSKKGARAENWKKGKPVRVVRSHKLGVHSKYAPEKGNRYDGIYKVVEYWKEKGKSGFDVWRYRLRRDDETPAPWTAAGKKRTKSLGLKLIYPDGYQEAMSADKKENTPNARRKVKSPTASASKKIKAESYKLPAKIEKLIEKDCNKKLWEESKSTLSEGKMAFLSKVTDIFTCTCCQELIFEPITTKCLHNLCKKCLKRSLAADVSTCPYCRQDLGSESELTVNKELSSILLSLFPGYQNGR